MKYTKWFLMLCVSLTLTADRGFAASGPVAQAPFSSEETQQLLRTELKALQGYVEVTMQDAERMLKRRNVSQKDIDILKEWQKVQSSSFKPALDQPDPLAALLDAWAVSESLAKYFEEGTLKLPPSTRELALQMLDRRRQRILEIVRQYISSDVVDSLSHNIDHYAVSEGLPAVVEIVQKPEAAPKKSFSLWAKGQEAIGGILSIPLIPGRAVSGLTQSGQALSELKDTGNRAVEVAAELPQKVRQEMELMMDRIVAEQVMIKDMLHDISLVSSNIGQVAEKAQQTTVSINETIGEVHEMLPSVKELTESADAALISTRELVGAIQTLRDSMAAENTKEKKPFSVGEYHQAAMAIEAGAAELNQLMAQIQEMMAARKNNGEEQKAAAFDPKALAELTGSVSKLVELLTVLLDEDGLIRMQEMFTVSARTSEDLVDHVFFRMVQYAVLILALILATIWVSVRLRKRKL